MEERRPGLPVPDALYKYATVDTAQAILSTGTLRWSSPELFDEPWAIKQNAALGFDHTSVNHEMLKTAVAMIFMRDMPSGNPEHPLYKAIRRWRSEDRFHDEAEAHAALRELLAPTPETLESKLKKLTCKWHELVEHARVVCFSETVKDIQSWERFANNHAGVALRFESADMPHAPMPVEYSNQRCQLTSLKEQVHDLVGIEKAPGEEAFINKLLTKPRFYANEKEWRSIRVMAEEDLDCGEDVVDWFLDEPFTHSDLRAIYLGFRIDEADRGCLIDLIRTAYPSTTIYQGCAAADSYELEFTRVADEGTAEAS